jgi:hypothetical protein
MEVGWNFGRQGVAWRGTLRPPRAYVAIIT